MIDCCDDDFCVCPSVLKNWGKGQGQSFVSKVFKQVGKVSSGKFMVCRLLGGQFVMVDVMYMYGFVVGLGIEMLIG